MSFFRQFPTINYDLKKDGSIMRMVNIFRNVRPLQNYVDNPSLYKFYEIKNGERPDTVSQRLYGTPDFYWTFFVINEFLHDGYKVWPLSQEQLFDYIKEQYNGYAITTKPVIVRTGDGTISEFRDSLSGKFQLGETITGSVSNAQGTLTKKNLDMNQLVIQDMQNTNRYSGDGAANNNNYELLIGSSTQDSVSSYEVFNYADAPHHYYITDEDGVDREYSNMTFINQTAATPAANLKAVSNRQYVNDLNEERSKIRVINPNFIGRFIENFESLLNE
jgi:hypothetical protein